MATLKIYNGSGFVDVANQVTDHGALTGNGDDDHTQYLLASGARAMSGDLLMGGNDITTPGLVDGRDVSVDGTKLDGIDPLAQINPTNTELLASFRANTVGTSFPGSPVDGDLFFRTDHDAEFRWDAGRSKWLGQIEGPISWGKTSAAATNLLRGPGNTNPNSGFEGFYMPWDYTIVGFSFSTSTNAVTADFEIQRVSTTVHTHADSGRAGRDTTINQDVAGSANLKVKVKSGSDTMTDCQANVWLRRHET